MDFAQLERTSVSFFEVEKPETAVSRWSRASTRVAKVGSESLRHTILWCILLVMNFFLPLDRQVGKGLSQDEKARKLALQHWLEAVSLMLRILLSHYCCTNLYFLLPLVMAWILAEILFLYVI